MTPRHSMSPEHVVIYLECNAGHLFEATYASSKSIHVELACPTCGAPSSVSQVGDRAQVLPPVVSEPATRRLRKMLEAVSAEPDAHERISKIRTLRSLKRL